MAGVEQGEVEREKKEISTMRKLSMNDTGKYTSASNSQISLPRFSVLVHAKSAARTGLKREVMPVREETM